MVEVDVRIPGLRDLRGDYRALARDVTDDVAAETLRQAGEVARVAATLAPRRSGALAGSLRAVGYRDTATVVSRLPYANVVHWGGTIRPRGTAIRFRPTEFVTRAFERREDAIVDGVGDAVERSARRHGWR